MLLYVNWSFKAFNGWFLAKDCANCGCNICEMVFKNTFARIYSPMQPRGHIDITFSQQKTTKYFVETNFANVRGKIEWKFIFLQAKPTKRWWSVIWFQSWPLQPRHETLAKWIPSGRKSPTLPEIVHQVCQAKPDSWSVQSWILEQSMGARHRGEIGF